MIALVILMASVAVFLSRCDKGDNYSHVLDIESNFREDDGGWEPFFAGFNVGWEERMELLYLINFYYFWVYEQASST